MKNNHKSTHLAHAHKQLWLMFKCGTGHAVVAGVGFANGSRAKYDVDVLTPEQQCLGIGHDII